MIKEGKCATEAEMLAAIEEHKPFGAHRIIVLTNKPYYPEKIRAIGRLIVLDGDSGKVLFAEDNNHSAVEKFKGGWKLDRQKALIGFGLDADVQGNLLPLLKDRTREQIRDALRTLQQLENGREFVVVKVLGQWTIR